MPSSSGSSSEIQAATSGNASHAKNSAFVPPFGPRNEAEDIATEGDSGLVTPHPTLEGTKAKQLVLDEIATHRNRSEKQMPPRNKTNTQRLGGNNSLKRYMKDLRLECVTGWTNFATLDTVRLVVSGLSTDKVGILFLERESPETWKRKSFAEIPADLEGLTIVATSKDAIYVSHVSLMEELASGLELHEARITKSLIFEENTPALNLTFVIICNLRDEIINEDVTDDDLVQMARILGNRGATLTLQFQRLGNLADITDAIFIQRQAIRVTPHNHAFMPGQWNNLGNSLQYRFERTGNLSDISDAIKAKQQAIQLTPNGHSDVPGRLNNLGDSLQYRFECTGNISDISDAIKAKQQAIRLTPNGDPYMSGRLNNLASSFLRRFESTGDLSDIFEAILTQQRAIQITPDDHEEMPGRLNNLGNLFQRRFERTGNPSDITQAITIKQRAIQLTPKGHSTKPIVLNNLGSSFRCRFELTGDLSDISEAISILQQAVQLTPNGHADMPGRLNNLGNSLLSRFNRTGALSDVSEAISALQRTVQLTPKGHADLPAQLNNLGLSYQHRFLRTSDLSDISEAISAQQQAVQLTPNDHTSDRSRWLNNLGISFLRRFQSTDDPSDISEAISNQQRAVQLTPNDHTNMAGRLNNLGLSFQNRFRRTGDLSDITEAISTLQRAIHLTPDGHVSMPAHLNNLGISFQYLFQRTGELSDISEAILTQQRAIQLTPDGHAGMPAYLTSLGVSFQHRFQRKGDLPDIYTAISLFRKSATTLGSPSVRLDAAHKWAHASIAHDHQQSMEACGIMIDLISQIAGMDRTVEQRHTDLVHISSLTTAAASAAFAEGEFEKALEWLEQGRCLVWGQLNQLRTPVDDLRAHNETLAVRFLDISRDLESSGSRHGPGNFNPDTLMSQKITLQDEARIHVKLADEWNQLLEEIRLIPGFRDFLRPPLTSDLLRNLPPDGPIILINVHESRCDALALTFGSDTPIHIPLDNFTYKQGLGLRERLRNFLSSRQVRFRSEDRGPRPVVDHDSETPSEIHAVLETLWVCVVKPILDGLAYSSHTPLDPARIWWCPTGPLAFLPLHAAGIYSQNETPPPGSCISDFAVSSYTPTVSTLVQNFKGSTYERPLSTSNLLIVSQPNTPGRSRIPGTTVEMNAIWQTIGPAKFDSLCLEAEAATVSRVISEMKSHSSIHFACHASQDMENPLRSGFYLHDGRLELAEIMRQKISHCELAFLSACQTSTGDERLSEEAVHLAAGMLAVGYQGVVATMWSIKDQYGPVVAESFYKYLVETERTFGNFGFDSASAARALHHAIQGIRDRVGHTEQGLLTWVPYVHFGY